MKFHIVTRCTRQHNLKKLKANIFQSLSERGVEREWHIVFDTKILKDVDAELLAQLSDIHTNFYFNSSDGWGLTHLNEIIEGFDPGWVYHLDDDNLLTDNFYSTLIKEIRKPKNSEALVFVFDQQVDGKDFTGLDVREAKPENMKVRHVDLAQWLVHTKVHNSFNLKYGTGYTADGEFIETTYNNELIQPHFRFISKILSNYNFLEKKAQPRVPKVLYIGNDKPELKSKKWLDYEDDSLDVKYVKDDSGIEEHLASFKPDIILSSSKGDWQDYPRLASMPLHFRQNWVNINEKEDVDRGETAYNAATFSMLSERSLMDSELISFFTPIYNTGEKLWNTYRSLQNQTYTNWEWVLVNDSTDGGKTLKIAEQIAKKDPRVRVYDFREKSGGIIGEVKWRACTMSKGYLLAELDHDDLLTPWCAMDLYNASKKHPECGFFSNETSEVREDWTSPTYPEGFAFGYGKYREEEYNGKKLQVVVQHNINPKTIRHIVGIPNHIRAWRRDVYFKIGGHNRYLSVADDYELMVRTFLETKICLIPRLGYLQFIYNNANGRNTHDLSRADIQRRVRSIASFYNEKIKSRFEELGVEDWAYAGNPMYPIATPSRFGEDEGAVNIIYQEGDI